MAELSDERIREIALEYFSYEPDHVARCESAIREALRAVPQGDEKAVAEAVEPVAWLGTARVDVGVGISKDPCLRWHKVDEDDEPLYAHPPREVQPVSREQEPVAWRKTLMYYADPARWGLYKDDRKVEGHQYHWAFDADTWGSASFHQEPPPELQEAPWSLAQGLLDTHPPVSRDAVLVPREPTQQMVRAMWGAFEHPLGRSFYQRAQDAWYAALTILPPCSPQGRSHE